MCHFIDFPPISIPAFCNLQLITFTFPAPPTWTMPPRRPCPRSQSDHPTTERGKTNRRRSYKPPNDGRRSFFSLIFSRPQFFNAANIFLSSDRVCEWVGRNTQHFSLGNCACVWLKTAAASVYVGGCWTYAVVLEVLDMLKFIFIRFCVYTYKFRSNEILTTTWVPDASRPYKTADWPRSALPTEKYPHFPKKNRKIFKF